MTDNTPAPPVRVGSTKHDHHTPSERFWAKVDRSSDCWLWLASLSKGYGSFRIGGRSVAAHRYSWESTNGPVADGLVLDHLCRDTRCVRPDHLEPVTIGENMRRGLKTYAIRNWCKNGHDITIPENVKVRSSNRRECRLCAQESWHRWNERRAAVAS